MIDRFALTIVPSATLWLHWRNGVASDHAAPALVFADPAFIESPQPQESAQERAWPWKAGTHFGPLPHARREGRSIKEYLGDDCQLLLGNDAAEHFLKTNDLDRFSVLHFAAHALVDEQFPDRSAILLSPGSTGEDGWLQIREIVDLDLAGQLVVLSACQSASGPVVSGEGVLSLARGFFQAGAHVVVGSLWPLRDDDAAFLFESFYRNLAGGMPIASALRHAQQEARGEGLPAAAWASLTVVGDGAATPFPGGLHGPSIKVSPGWVVLLIAVSAAAAIALFYFYQFPQGLQFRRSVRSRARASGPVLE